MAAEAAYVVEPGSKSVQEYTKDHFVTPPSDFR